MIKKRIYFWTYSKYISKPVIADVILNTGVKINILKAKVEPQEAFLILEIIGDEEVVNKALEYLSKYGELEEIKDIIKRDEERCVHCGCCVTQCPFDVIYVSEDYSIEFDKDKCVGCKNCVKACPFKALKVLE